MHGTPTARTAFHLDLFVLFLRRAMRKGLSLCLSVCLSVYLHGCLAGCSPPSVRAFVCVCVCVCVCVGVCACVSNEGSVHSIIWSKHLKVGSGGGGGNQEQSWVPAFWNKLKAATDWEKHLFIKPENTKHAQIFRGNPLFPSNRHDNAQTKWTCFFFVCVCVCFSANDMHVKGCVP